MNLLPIFLSALIAYLLAALPTGYLAGRLWGVDVRQHGSGRTGGSNVLRSAGWGAFAVTVIGDIAKGALGVMIARALFPDAIEAHAVAVFFALLGHVWSVWIALLAKPDARETFASPPLGWIQMIAQRGRGGAGVSPLAGALMTLYPPLALVAPFGLIILTVTRYSSVASISVCVATPMLMLYFVLTAQAPVSYFFSALSACALIIFLLRPNIERLRAGNERKFGERLGRRARSDAPDSKKETE